MKKNLAALFLIAGLQLSGQKFVWAKQMGGENNDLARSVVTDSYGNVYTTGLFTGTADFDPNSGVYPLTSASPGFSDIYVSKSDPSGALVWAVKMGGSNSDGGNALALDPLGNVYVTGYFWSQDADFDPDADTLTLGGYGTFVAKLDGSGNLLWAAKLGNTSTGDEGLAIAADALGNVYTTGTFEGIGDFDPGPAALTFTSMGSTDVFLSKLDAAGNYVWAKQFRGTGRDAAFALALSGTNIYLGGNFRSSSMDFDPGPNSFFLHAQAAPNSWVCQLNSNGDLSWAVKFDGGSNSAFGLAANTAGVFFTGSMSGAAVDFDPGPGTYMLSPAAQEVYVCHLDHTGNLVWVKQLTTLVSAGPSVGNAITLDATGNVYTAGYFSGTVDFDPGAGVDMMNAAGDADIFVSKLDPAGNFVWAAGMGGSSRDWAMSVCLDAQENIITAGLFENTADFKPNQGLYELTSAGSNDIFISKLRKKNHNEDEGARANVTGILNIQGEPGTVQLLPNPAGSHVAITWPVSGRTELTLYDAIGKLVHTQIADDRAAEIDLQRLPAGIYYLRLSGTHYSETKKLVKE